MSDIAVRWGRALDALASGTDRLVHPSVREPARARQAQLVGAVLCGLCLFALSLCIVLPGKIVSPAGLIVLGTAGALGVAALLCLAARAPERLSSCLALLAGTAAAWTACRLGGGLASPLAIGLGAVPLEAWLLRRSRFALLAGLAAAAVAAGTLLLGGIAGGAEVPAHPVTWLPVLLWGATLACRAVRARPEGSHDAQDLAPALHDAVVLRFEPSGEIADASPSAHDLLGLAPELLLGSGLFERLHVGDRVHFLCAAGDMKHGADRRSTELRVRLPGTSPQFRSFRLDLFRTGDAAFPFAGTLRDNTELQNLRDRIETQNETLSETLREKAQLLATLGHELRTPLNAILGFSGILASDSLRGRDPRQKEYAGLIQGCGEHLLGVIDAMLDLGRLRAGARQVEPEAFCLREAAEGCRSMLALHAGAKGVALRLDAGMVTASAMADRRIVQQILINLVSNAVKFTPAGGHVTLGASVCKGELRLQVSDTGIGIAATDLEKLGTPWTRLDASRASEGHGLGLSLVKELAALHGGAVCIESVRGRGTTVVVSIPNAASVAPGLPRREPALSLIGESSAHGGFRKTA